MTARTLSQFKNLFDLCSFIETGTYAGDMTAEALKVFKEVHSIEVWEPLFRKAQKRFILFSEREPLFGRYHYPTYSND